MNLNLRVRQKFLFNRKQSVLKSMYKPSEKKTLIGFMNCGVRTDRRTETDAIQLIDETGVRRLAPYVRRLVLKGP
jgi:hypothetical protein